MDTPRPYARGRGPNVSITPARFKEKFCSAFGQANKPILLRTSYKETSPGLLFRTGFYFCSIFFIKHSCVLIIDNSQSRGWPPQMSVFITICTRIHKLNFLEFKIFFENKCVNRSLLWGLRYLIRLNRKIQAFINIFLANQSSKITDWLVDLDASRKIILWKKRGIQITITNNYLI